MRFPTRSDNKSPPNHASVILVGLFFVDSVVPEIGVPDPEGILVPVVTEGTVTGYHPLPSLRS